MNHIETLAPQRFPDFAFSYPGLSDDQRTRRNTGMAYAVEGCVQYPDGKPEESHFVPF